MSEEQDTQTAQRPGKRRTGLILAVAVVATLLAFVLVRLFTHGSDAHGAASQVVKVEAVLKASMTVPFHQ
jgi:hypothetical protein